MTAARRRLLQGLAGLAACVAAPGPTAAADVYALVIGIDAYAHIGRLEGARNDAADVSAALAENGAREVRMLVDGQATREAIFRNWYELSALADAGDTLIFHFAGHGARQDAILRDGHEDKDNLFLMAGFAEEGPGRQQRIVDNEIGHLLGIETEATVVFVADSCFAGGMTRAVDKRARLGVRTPGIEVTDVDDDAVEERVRRLGEVQDAARRHVIWIEGQDKNKAAPEIAIDGMPRGALSYAFARALRGDADRNGDGRLNVAELKQFINPTVVRLSERRQRPEVNAGSPDLAIPLGRTVHRPAAPAVALPEQRLFVAGTPLSYRLSGAVAAAGQTSADLVYVPADRVLINRTGDVVAEFDRSADHEDLEAGLQGAIDKWRLLGLLAALDSAHDPDVWLRDGDRVYRDGETVGFRLKSASHRYVTLFNLAYDGTVQPIPPAYPAGRGDLIGELVPGRVQEDEVRVIPPFGADHLVAITTPSVLPELGDRVFAAGGRRSAAELGEDLASLLQGREFGVGWVGVYTEPWPVDR